MEEYKALSYIFRLSVELAKNSSLFYHLGFLFGYRGEELILLLLYSHFNYKLSFYLMDVKISCHVIFSFVFHTPASPYAYIRTRFLLF